MSVKACLPPPRPIPRPAVLVCKRDDDNTRCLNPINQTVRVIAQGDTAGIMADAQSNFGTFTQSFRHAIGYITEITCDAVSGIVPVKPHRFAEFGSGMTLPDKIQLRVFFSKSSISANTSS